MATFRVSHLAAFARWRDDEESDVDWLINDIIRSEETEPMRRGTAFHKALETIKDGWEGTEITSGEYRFVFTVDVAISLPQTRETRRSKDYGGIVVSGQADGIGGKIIIDHKTTSHFDAENYLEGWQHKFYLDIFEADRFDWYGWEMKKIEPEFDPHGQDHMGEENIDLTVYEVFGFHQLTQYRYPGLEKDCADLAADFKKFADRYLGSYTFKPDGDSPRATVPLGSVGTRTDVTSQLKASLELGASKEFGMVATKGTNVIGVGYKDGVLRVCFAGKDGPKFWRYRDVPAAEFVKFGRSPFPDRLFSTNIRNKFKGEAEVA